MAASYWDKVLARRISRRRALAATGAGAAGAVILSACGGDDDSGSGSELLINGKEKDTTKSAKKGGTYKANVNFDPQNFDLYNFDPFSQNFANLVGTKMLAVKPTILKEQTELEFEGDLASSWETSPDKLTWTFKLNPAVKWAPLSPSFHAGAPQSIGNRQIDADDFVFSWKRFIATASSSAADLAKQRDKTAPVLSVTAIDKQTVQFKLDRPFSPLLTDLAISSVSYPYVLPKEGEGKSDQEFWFKYQFGSGPFYIDSYTPSVKLTLKANPNFRSRDPEGRPYVDQVDMPIIPDASVVHAQFRAGNLFGQGPTFSQYLGTPQDILQLKKDIPELQLLSYTDSLAVTEWFGMSGIWKDQRLRQAVQYSWDRDTFIDAMFATASLEGAGVPANKRWNTCLPCGDTGSYMYFPGAWLDPQGKDFGENAKWVTLGARDKNIAEAKKLLAAAGYANGLEFTHLQYPIPPFPQQASQDLIEGMMREAGIKATKQTKQNIPEIFGTIFGKGNFPEMFNTVDFPPGDVGTYLAYHYLPAGLLYGAGSDDDKGVDGKGDAYMVSQTNKILAEFDTKAKNSLVQDFQRYAQKMFYYSRYPGGATQLVPVWPAVQNFNVYRGYGADRMYTYEWLDPTKAPLA